MSSRTRIFSVCEGEGGVMDGIEMANGEDGGKERRGEETRREEQRKTDREGEKERERDGGSECRREGQMASSQLRRRVPNVD